MFTPFIKVCGIQSLDEARGAVEAGANTIGLLLGLTHLAEDKIAPETSKIIVASLSKSIRSVMVTHLLDADEIAEIANYVGVSAIQIHDALSVEGMKKLRILLPGRTLIKAVHVTGKDAILHAKKYGAHSDFLLLDSRTKDRLGGTGLTHDWKISQEIVRSVQKPVILAGGLNPDNIVEAIEMVQPAGIDANSGLENPDGRKNFEKIKIFARAGLKCRYPDFV